MDGAGLNQLRGKYARYVQVPMLALAYPQRELQLHFEKHEICITCFSLPTQSAGAFTDLIAGEGYS